MVVAFEESYVVCEKCRIKIVHASQLLSSTDSDCLHPVNNLARSCRPAVLSLEQENTLHERVDKHDVTNGFNEPALPKNKKDKEVVVAEAPNSQVFMRTGVNPHTASTAERTENIKKSSADTDDGAQPVKIATPGMPIASSSSIKGNKDVREIHVSKFSVQQAFALNPFPRQFEVILARDVDKPPVVTEVGPPPSLEHTWFENFKHQIIVCMKCGNHVGWMYTRAGSSVSTSTTSSDAVLVGAADAERQVLLGAQSDSCQTQMVSMEKFYGFALKTSRWPLFCFVSLLVVFFAWQAQQKDANLFLTGGAFLVAIVKLSPYMLV